MIREEAIKHKDMIVAFTEGADIEYHTTYGVWCNTYNPQWDFNVEYRIKSWVPKPGEMIEVWDGDESIPVTREFLSMTKDGKKYAVYGLDGRNVYSYKYAKEIK